MFPSNRRIPISPATIPPFFAAFKGSRVPVPLSPPLPVAPPPGRGARARLRSPGQQALRPGARGPAPQPASRIPEPRRPISLEPASQTSHLTRQRRSCGRLPRNQDSGLLCVVSRWAGGRFWPPKKSDCWYRRKSMIFSLTHPRFPNDVLSGFLPQNSPARILLMRIYGTVDRPSQPPPPPHHPGTPPGGGG